MARAINLRQVEMLKAVVEHGTVSRAAVVLGISQPAASKLLMQLERDGGLKLFDRARGRLAPTAQGMRLYEEIDRIFAGVRQVETAIAVIRREDTGENGQIVVALIDDGEVTLKRLRRRGHSVALEPATPRHESRIFPADRVRVQGRLVGLLRQY